MNDDLKLDIQEERPPLKDTAYGWPERAKPLKCVCGDPQEVCKIHEREDQEDGEVQG